MYSVMIEVKVENTNLIFQFGKFILYSRPQINPMQKDESRNITTFQIKVS